MKTTTKRSTRDSGNPIKERAKVRGSENIATGGSHNCLAYLVPCDPRMLFDVGVPFKSKCTQCGSHFTVEPK